MVKEYIAEIHRNFYDVSSCPKVLLTNIRCPKGRLFRDHCWIEITDKIDKYIPDNNRYFNTITVSAKKRIYTKNGTKKYTLSIRKVLSSKSSKRKNKLKLKNR